MEDGKTLTKTEVPPAAPPAKQKFHGTALANLSTYEPKNYAELKSMAIELAQSDIIPQAYQKKSGNIVVAVMYGKERGLNTMSSLQSIMVVNGRPSMWGDIVKAKCEASGLLEWDKDVYDPKLERGTVTYTVQRKGKPYPCIRTFSMDDAKKAGIEGKAGPWQGYPKRMLFQRARAFALRDEFGDVLNGLQITEELLDIIETTAVRENGTTTRLPPPPARPGEAAAQPAAEAAAPQGQQDEDAESGENIGIPVVVQSVPKLGYRIELKDEMPKYVTENEDVAKLLNKAKRDQTQVKIAWRKGEGVREIETVEVVAAEAAQE